MSKKIGQEDVMGLFNKMMNPMGLSMQNPFMPVLDPEELEKKITELKTVEMWLSSNLSMLQLTIKTLEYQQALLTPPEKRAEFTGEMPDNPFANPALWPWNAMKTATEEMTKAPAGKTPAKKTAKRAARKKSG
jgi:hypothetical protein